MNDKPDRLIDLTDIMERTGLGRSTIYKLISKGDFPRQIKVGKCTKWRESDFNRWIDGLSPGDAA